MFAASYETLNAAPHAVFDALFAYCGISAPDSTMLDRILAQDSQAGTRLSRVEQARLELSDADVAELKHVLKELSPELTADFIVPGTFVA